MQNCIIGSIVQNDQVILPVPFLQQCKDRKNMQASLNYTCRSTDVGLYSYPNLYVRSRCNENNLGSKTVSYTNQFLAFIARLESNLQVSRYSSQQESDHHRHPCASACTFDFLYLTTTFKPPAKILLMPQIVATT